MIDNKAFNLYLNDIKDIKVLSVEEEKYLFENFNPENRKKIIESNLKLVVALSREYYNIPFESLTYMDIIEAGNIGLIKAVERFDYKKGYKFSTFASYYIKSQIIKEIYKNNRIIRRPFNQERLISKKLKTIQTVLSLDDSFPNSIDGTEPLLYFIEDEENNIYDEINQIEIKEIIKDILNTLTPRQKEVLLLRFGFDDGNYKTLRKVGSILKISDEGVRKIEQKAFTKIRKNNNLKDIK
ncbi:MAG TPA: sigma-70 family RNA polymerase sigma factor [Bacilli bacterium]|nr:sigma-70 family RNA polymerase sigma factor [Bacilli bacterium]